jgi:hypothetical protein
LGPGAATHRRFFSLDEANAAIAEQVEAFNNRPFSPPREGSRRSLFEAIERGALMPLPATPFVIGQWLTARVNFDYHIVVALAARGSPSPATASCFQASNSAG